MRKIERTDIMTNEQYLKERDVRRKTIIELRKLRRVEVGENLSFTFENRETVKYQIQEMMRVERITGEEKIAHELHIYNELIPELNTLSATMFIEISDQNRMKSILDSFQGLDQPGKVYMIIDREKVPAEFETGHSKEDRISAVHYVKFRLSEEQARKFASAKVAIEIRHPAYTGMKELSAAQKEQLATDFGP